jgi:uncharacterized OsmC-like protein
MNAEQLRNLQAPLKSKYRAEPATGQATLKVAGTLQPGDLVCKVPTKPGIASAGLHPMAGGDGSAACSGDMLLESLVACAGVTLTVVAMAMGITLRGGSVTAEGDLDFRGTLGVSKEVDVGFKEIRLQFKLDSDATAEQVQSLLKLTERYCVIYQTLVKSPAMKASIAASGVAP